jgi:bidirectional [NiFe] hydrogenase diaphorase subunit
MPITVTIDGRTSSVAQGTTILRAARDLGIVIPTLCHNDAVEPYAACRFCIVEASDGKGWSKIVTSCNYEVSDGLHVNTRSEEVVEARGAVLDLLLSAHPNAKPVRELAERYGVTEPSYAGDPGDDCILCGLCVRVCDQVVGVSALGFAGRGPARKMVSPFHGPSPTCIGCGSCVYVCPTQCLHIVDEGNRRVLYKQRRENVFKEFELLACLRCGKRFLPREQLAYVQKKFKLPRNLAQTCSTCGGPRV